MKTLYNLLFKKNDAIVINKLAKKVDKQYKESAAPIVVGSTVKLKKNYQVGEVIGFKGKRAIVKVGQLPMNIDIEDLLVVEKIEEVEVPKIGIGRNKTVVSKTPINKNIKK
jgi:DNA mismatch repair protein MutS2